MSDRQSLEYPFVSNVRFWSMVAIVAIHSMSLWGNFTGKLDVTGVTQLTLMQCFKFASPAFFIISGFLLGDRLDRSAPWNYFCRRLKRIGIPWLIWASVYFFFALVRYDLPLMPLGQAIQFQIIDIFFHSVYWYVPNYLFSLAILLLFRNHLDSRWLGLCLACISLFYAANVYGKWLSVEHSAAIGAFVPFLWLGNWANRHKARVREALTRISSNWIAALTLLAGLFSAAESILLIRCGSEGSLSALRLSNQLFALLMVMLLLKSRSLWPRWVNVRKETFGIYLLHLLTLIIARQAIAQFHLFAFNHALADDSRVWSNPLWAIAYWATAFIVGYGGALVATKLFIAFRLGALVGYSREKAPLSPAEGSRLLIVPQASLSPLIDPLK